MRPIVGFAFAALLTLAACKSGEDEGVRPVGISSSTSAIDLSSEQAVDSPVLVPVPQAGLSQLASDGDLYFATWIQDRGDGQRVYGARLNADGRLIDGYGYE